MTSRSMLSSGGRFSMTLRWRLLPPQVAVSSLARIRMAGKRSGNALNRFLSANASNYPTSSTEKTSTESAAFRNGRASKVARASFLQEPFQAIRTRRIGFGSGKDVGNEQHRTAAFEQEAFDIDMRVGRLVRVGLHGDQQVGAAGAFYQRLRAIADGAGEAAPFRQAMPSRSIFESGNQPLDIDRLAVRHIL